jgi:UDP-2-acetamido-3-amino-2,3-dideoxy-glucuronate N-acetyltransferase
MPGPYIDPTAVVEPGSVIGEGTKIWRGVHVMSGAVIGRECVLGQGCFVAATVRIGDGCRIQNHVSLYDGVTLAEDVFLGPSCVFTNVRYPRAHVARKHDYEPTSLQRGVSVGANATILCGVTVGGYAMIGAGAVVTAAVPAYARMIGVPARQVGWTCRCGEPLPAAARNSGWGEDGEILHCRHCADAYLGTACGLVLVDSGA